LLNEAAAEIGVDQTTPRSFDRRHEAIIANGFAFRKTGKSLGFEDAHNYLRISITYRYMNYNSRNYK